MNIIQMLRNRKKSSNDSYRTLFIKESGITARTGKMVYIRRDFHETIRAIGRVIGNDQVTISGYIDNVLAHHFETYGDEIMRLYNENNKGLTIKNQE